MTLPIGEIICGDCLDVMRGWPDGSIDAVITDPPYGLSFMGKAWDYDVPKVELWREVYRVLKDGGRLLAFAGARTQHRMVCNIEDAGFTIEDCMMWLYGSGFPKHKSKLKPAYEPICVARKGKVSLLNIDAARIDSPKGAGVWGSSNATCQAGRTMNQSPDGADYRSEQHPAGRWPANICLDEEAAAMLDEQSGTLTSGTGAVKRATSAGHRGNALGAESRPIGTPMLEYGDSGGASRFYYCAKASRSERNAGLQDPGPRRQRNDTTGGKYAEAPNPPGSNDHPTVKPIDLMQWLVRLTTFPGEIVLDPFFGSGTTGVACNREGRPFIGIELNPDYCAIARRRTAQKGLALEVAV